MSVPVLWEAGATDHRRKRVRAIVGMPDGAFDQVAASGPTTITIWREQNGRRTCAHERVRHAAHQSVLPAGPLSFVDRQYLIITYRSDPEAIGRLLPEPLEVAGPLVHYEWRTRRSGMATSAPWRPR